MPKWPGQEHIVRALINTLKLQRLHHAYLFCGTRGVGKTTLARILAKCFNCQQGPTSEPCDQCDACRGIDQGNFVDLIEIDAASHTGIDDIREIIDSVQYMPSSGRFKIYLIDEVHMLSMNSFNALLKTLEEPPPHVKFFFATTHPQKLPVTILSRCLQFKLMRLTVTELQTYLAKRLSEEKVVFEDAALRQLAIAAQGSVRDALSLLDHALVHGGGELRLQDTEAMLGIVAQNEPIELLDCIVGNDVDALIEKINKLYSSSADFVSVLASLLTLFHEITLTQMVEKIPVELQFEQKDLQRFANTITAEELQLFYQIALQGKKDLPFLPSQKNAFEMVMLRMLSFKLLTPSDDIKPKQVKKASPGKTTKVKKTKQADAKPSAGKVSPSQTSAKQAISSEPTEAAQNVTQTMPDEPVMESGTQNTSASDSLLKISSTEDWLALIQQLPLSGPLKEFCYRSLFQYIPPNCVVLSLIDKDESLLQADYADQLSQLLSHHMNDVVQVQFKFTQIEQETPRQIENRRKQEREENQENQLKQDPIVQALQNEMGAIVVKNETRILRK